MPWYAWIAILTIATLATGLIVYILVRRSNDAAETLAKVARLSIDMNQKREAADQEAKLDIQKANKELAAKLRTINTWYLTAKDQISKGKKDEYEILVGNPDALDRKLDQLLGGTTKDKPQ